MGDRLEVITNKMVIEEPFLINFNANHIIDALSPFRKKWTIIVFMEFQKDNVVTFQYLQKKFSLSPSVLSSTLKELTSEMLISRRVYGEVPPLKVEYKITLHGKKLMKALSYLIEWIYDNKRMKT